MAALGFFLGAAPVRAAPRPRQPRVVVSGVEFPAGIAFADDGTMYFTERGGRVRVFQRGDLDPEPLFETSTTTAGETGFLGLAVSPDQASVYVFITDPSGTSNKIVKVPRGGGDAEVVVEGLPGSGYHNGGGVAFLDDHLLVTNGETHDSARSQDPDALGGKVYRFTLDGDVPGDNPFPETATYALGLRNPFGIALDPISGAAFVTENGPESHDEVNRIEAGGNYGWPDTSGPASDPSVLDDVAGDYHDPLLDYPEIIVPTGIAFTDPKDAVRRYRGDLFFGAFDEQTIHRVELSEDRTTAIADDVFVEEGDPVIALAWGPAGLYYSTPTAIKVLPMAKEDAAPPVSTPDGGDRSATDDDIFRFVVPIAVFVVLLAALYLIDIRMRRSQS